MPQYATYGLACGGAILGAAILTLAASVFVIHTEDADADPENWGGAPSAWGRVEDKPGPVVGLAPAPVPQQQAQAPPPSDYSAQNPQFRAPGVQVAAAPGVQVTSAPPPGPRVPVEQILPQVRDFYRKYDAGKKDEDVVNISRWAAQNGLVALNKKLRDKYGADLETLRGPPV